jgi:hypothetical protein
MSDSKSHPRPWVVGDEVVIADYSEAHGDKGKIVRIQDNGIILVELEQGCVWPVTAEELWPQEVVVVGVAAVTFDNPLGSAAFRVVATNTTPPGV